MGCLRLQGETRAVGADRGAHGRANAAVETHTRAKTAHTLAAAGELDAHALVDELGEVERRLLFRHRARLFVCVLVVAALRAAAGRRRRRLRLLVLLLLLLLRFAQRQPLRILQVLKL